MYRLFTDEKKQIVCSTEYSRAVGDTKYVFRAHPNYKSKGAWYDWMVLNYLTEDDTLTSHIARLVTVVHDPEIIGNFVPVIQWAGTLTGKLSVLMTEYHISQSFMDYDECHFRYLILIRFYPMHWCMWYKKQQITLHLIFAM